jgi:cytochrome c-type biogenesis protein CcmH
MSSRDWFWFLAGVLVTVAITVTARPWLRERPAQTVRPAIPPFAVPIAAALALIGVALGIYFLLGSPDSIASAHGTAPGSDTVPSATNTSSSQQMNQPSATAGSLDDVTRKLATRLATTGGSDSEWTLLAQSYEYMGRTAEAKAARAHVASAAPSDMGASSSETASAALDNQTMAAIANALSTPADATSTAVPAASSTATSTAAGRAEVSGTIDIVSKLAARAGAGATLFVYAKQPNTPGPPLAVVRLRVEHWPVSFTLTDANSMVPGRNLSTAQTVQIEARVSSSGDAIPQSGDLVGSVTSVSPRGGHPVKISIDREIG